MYFEQQTKYCFVCKRWGLADDIKKALNIPTKWKYMNIRDIYRYTDLQRTTNDVIQPMESVTDYYSKDVIGVLRTLQEHIKPVMPDLISDTESSYESDDDLPYQPMPDTVIVPVLISDTETESSYDSDVDLPYQPMAETVSQSMPPQLISDTETESEDD
jgi:hypothetical protein